MQNKVSIISSASIVGRKEGEGPLSNHFDLILEDSEWGEESWEKTESKLQRESVLTAIRKANIAQNQLNYIFAGDLLNQCIGSVFGLRDLAVPFFGLFGACSTMAEGISLGAMVTDGGFSDYCACVTSSHFCTAERQFRMPLEYGGQRPSTSQWTVTGSGAVILSNCGGGPYVGYVTAGKIIDMGIKDPNNMGAAMAPAAVDTLIAHFNDTGRKPDFYDLIVSGDLGSVGKSIVIEMMQKSGYSMKNYNDCGCMIFDLDKQQVNAGGSGCGCGAATLCGYILENMKNKTYKNVLFMATGALMSPTTTLQGESIPSIAHAISISNDF